jgi:hypothetical protein
MENNTDLTENKSCKAILEQGTNRGKQCWRPALDEGYCGKHHTQATIKKSITDGKRKCLRFRCRTILEKEHLDKYCNTCKAKKDEENKEKKLCAAIIQQHDNKGKQCDKKASDGNYCGKHKNRNELINTLNITNQRVCDDGKRACKNLTKDNKTKCEECLEKIRLKENEQYRLRNGLFS